MKYHHPSKELFIRNRKLFSDQLKPSSAAIFHSSDIYPIHADRFHKFQQQSDIYYLTGIDQEETILVLTPDHPDPSFREILFIRSLDPQVVIWEGEKLSIEKAESISGVSKIYNLNNYEIVLKELLYYVTNIYFNFNEYAKFFSDIEDRNSRKAREVMNKYPTHSFERSAPILHQLRMVKTREEIEIIKKACEITEKSFRHLLNAVKPEMMEYQVEAELEYVFKYNGATGSAYEPIVAGGENACSLHYIKNDKELKDGQLLLLDMGAEYGNYASDMSRTIPVNGRFTKRQKECYNAVLDVFKKACQKFTIGNTLKGINEYVNDLMQEACIKLGLFSEEDLKNQEEDYKLLQKYYMHKVSHHIGLNVHDVFDPNAKFEAGMVLTCEPGIYIKEEGIGIRIENDILVTLDGPVDLMANIPIEVEEIESLMNSSI
ncbi:MAG: aminopeptidase P N-terminal domain-containing protein [Hyphomicrobiales bacterium]